MNKICGQRWDKPSEINGKALVVDTTQVAAPNDEVWPGGMSRTPELYLRPMQTSPDMAVQSTHPGAVRRK